MCYCEWDQIGSAQLMMGLGRTNIRAERNWKISAEKEAGIGLKIFGSKQEPQSVLDGK